ncbi:MAG TPA: CoA transferase [Acidimicrobiales bacterium]|nr:CoA transferase [Acidimicrobiales bacterium]
MEPHLPLAGVRVIDLTTFLSGPMATHTLGELGADVIKVEPPDGDPTRAGSRDGQTPFWLALHRDRRSVVLDLKRPAGGAALRDLVAASDVLIENFRPGVTARLGITDGDLRPLNPRLVYCSLTGYGTGHAAADQPATDGPIQAFTGAVALRGSPIPLTVGDLSGAAHAATAICAALYARQQTGRGCHIELSLAECLLQWLTVGDRGGTLAPPTTLVLTAADGARVLVQTPMHMRAKLLALVGEQDPRWSTVEGQRASLDEFVATMQAAFARRTAGEWVAALAAAGIPAAVVRTVEAALGDPCVATTDVGGETVVTSPFVVDGARRTATAAPPALGADTERVLRDVAGYDDARLAAARAGGAW